MEVVVGDVSEHFGPLVSDSGGVVTDVGDLAPISFAFESVQQLQGWSSGPFSLFRRVPMTFLAHPLNTFIRSDGR